MKMHSFLLSRALEVSRMTNESWIYNEDQQVNVMKTKNGKFIPVCCGSSSITESKTCAAPGDDDPDREAEVCY